MVDGLTPSPVVIGTESMMKDVTTLIASTVA